MKRSVAKISNHLQRLATFASDVSDHSRRLAKVANLRFALHRVQSKRTLTPPICGKYQRWSPRGRPWPRGRPRGQILKSLALALASRPQVLENWPVLGSRTALFFGRLKFCGAVEKFFGKRFFVEIA